MVWIGNIFRAFDNLNTDEMICLISRSKQRYLIYPQDCIEKRNGDLKISKNTCYCIIDVDEIENIIVAKTEVFKRVDERGNSE